MAPGCRLRRNHATDKSRRTDRTECKNTDDHEAEAAKAIVQIAGGSPKPPLPAELTREQHECFQTASALPPPALCARRSRDSRSSSRSGKKRRPALWAGRPPVDLGAGGGRKCPRHPSPCYNAHALLWG